METEALYWYNQSGNRYLTAEAKAEQVQQLLDRYRQLFGELPDNQ